MTTKPNLLLITADQMRWDSAGFAGNCNVQTPNLDALASRGVVFENAFTPNPICVPARASIMTGNYPQVCTGIKNNSGCIKPGQPLLTGTLKGAGYRTYASGKLHFVPYSPPGKPRLVHGFDEVNLTESGRILSLFDPKGEMEGLEDYFDYLKKSGWKGYSRAHGIGNNDVRPCPSPLPQELYVDSWIADCTIKQVDRHLKESPDRPFFIWMSSPKPHSPCDPPRPYDNLVDPRKIPFPAGNASDLESRNPYIETVRMTHALDSLSPQAWQVIRSYYYGNISFLDAMIGRVLKHLEGKGLMEDTIVLFTSDHGDLLGDFGGAFKCNHLNGSVRVPFLICGPGIHRGRRIADLAGLQDILPTFAEAAGTAINSPVQGESLWKKITGDTEEPVREVFYSSTMDSPNQSAMTTDGKWKYIYSEGNGTEELYNQKEDPAEVENLAEEKSCRDRISHYREVLREEALRLEDTAIIAGKGFAHAHVDREKIKKLQVSGMGWRWY